MNKKEAIEFLKKHQPMPDDSELTEEMIRKYDNIRKYFLEHPDKECIPLFLNSFGKYDGMGIYQLVEDVFLKYNSNEVIKHLEESLSSKYDGVRYWSAQIAALFPNDLLIKPLKRLLNDSIKDIQLAAIDALSSINNSNINSILQKKLEDTNDTDVIEFIKMVLDDIK